MQNKDAYDMKRVDITNLIVTVALIMIVCVQVILSRGLRDSIVPVMAGVIIIILSTINYFLPIQRFIKGLCFALLPGLVIIALFHVDKFALNKHYMVLITIAMVSLYFNPKMILVYSAIMNVAYIATYILNPEGMLAGESNFLGFFKIITLFNGILILLYFLAQWGNDLVEKATEKEKEATNILKKLQETFRSIENGTTAMDQNIGNINFEVSNIFTSSQGILESVQQMAFAIQDEAASIYSINDSMSHSIQGVNQTLMISKGIVSVTNEMGQKLDDGFDKISKVSERMDVLSSSIGTTVDTVSELKESLDKVNTLLDGIKNIAGQTNLLALNASIESARAGEQGKGFAVVAEQIRKLSEQSKSIVTDISAVTSTIFMKSEEAFEKAEEGETAVEEGRKLLKDITAYFKDIRDSYQNTNAELIKGMEEVEAAASNFIKIQEQISNVASISEENSASTEEILSIIVDENTKIAVINASVSEVHKLSSSLKNMIDKK